MRKKTNPRRCPATQADVKKAKDKATNDALRLALYIVLYVLVDKHGVSHKKIGQIIADVNYTVGSINRGYLKWPDIMRVLEEEYDVQLELR